MPIESALETPAVKEAVAHLNWCADEAIKLWDAHDKEGAIKSFFEYVAKHPGTAYIADVDRRGGYTLFLRLHFRDNRRRFRFAITGFGVRED